MKTIITILLVGNVLLSFAQEIPLNKSLSYRNSIQIEVGGAGGPYSINYERILFDKALFKTAIQAGGSIFGNSNSLTSLYRLDLTEIIGSRAIRFELGVGVSNYYQNSIHDDESKWEYLISFRGGIRYQKSDGRFIFRAAFTPMFRGSEDTLGLTPWVGISVGYLF